MFWPGANRASLAGLRSEGAGNGPVGAGFTVKVALRVTLLCVAVMVALMELVTVPVVMVNMALVAPAAMVTLAGTVATAGLPLVSVTTAPPLGAALLNVTVPCDVLPPVTLVGFSASEESAAGAGGGVTVSMAVRVVPLNVAEMTTELLAVTEAVAMLKLALVAPAATVTLAGTVATAGLPLVSA